MFLEPLLSWFTLGCFVLLGGGRGPVCGTHWVLLCCHILLKSYGRKKGSTRVHPQWAPVEEGALFKRDVFYPVWKCGEPVAKSTLRHTWPRRRPSSYLGAPSGDPLQALRLEFGILLVFFCRSSTASSSSCLRIGPPPRRGRFWV